MRNHELSIATAAASADSSEVSAQPSNPRDGVVLFDPCTMIDGETEEGFVLFGANVPAVTLTGWRFPCPASWSLAGFLHAGVWTPTPQSLIVQTKVDAGLLLAIAIQWFFLGALSINGLRRWREQGAFITICSAIAAALVFIPATERLARFPELFATITWLLWLAFAIWRASRLAWRRNVRPLSLGTT